MLTEDDIIIRTAELKDAPEILKVYAPYVKKTSITFEYMVPELEEFRERIRHTLERYPYIVAEKNGEIIGYAYTGPFKQRAAYDWATETSLYIKEGYTKSGLGKRLYKVIEAISMAQNIYNLNACIGYPEKEDEHLTKNSVQFHEHIGYKWVGEFHKCGYKFNTWVDMVWMEKILKDHPKYPEPVIWFPQLDRKTIDDCIKNPDDFCDKQKA